MPDVNLDQTDCILLNILQKDGRISNADLAEQAHLTPSTCLRRVKKLEECGVIEHYVAQLSPQAIGKASSVLVNIGLNNQQEDSLAAFEKAVQACPDVRECYLTAGEADYTLRIEFRDMADYERIYTSQLSRLPHVARIQSNFTIRTVFRKLAYDL